MKRPLKVLHIINNLEIGGAEKFLLLLLKYLSKNEDIELYLIALAGHGKLEKELENLKVTYKVFNYHFFLPGISRFDPFFRFRLFFYVRKIKPDLIHGHLFKGEDFAKTLGGILKIPVVTTLHDVMTWPGRRQFLLNRFLSRGVAVSEEAAKHLREAYHLPKEKITVIPNGIYVKEFEKSTKEFDPQKPIFLHIGRLLKTKGIDYALIGLSKLIPDYPNLKFLIYGKEVFKGEKAYLEELVKKNSWNFISFMGQTESAVEALGEGDIFVLASKSEGFALAVLEAAAAKKPAIVTKVGAIPDIIKEEVSGFFVNYGDSDQIYKAAKKMLDQGLVKEFGEKAYENAKASFDIQKVAKMYYNLYLTVIREKNARINRL